MDGRNVGSAPLLRFVLMCLWWLYVLECYRSFNVLSGKDGILFERDEDAEVGGEWQWWHPMRRSGGSIAQPCDVVL